MTTLHSTSLVLLFMFLSVTGILLPTTVSVASAQSLMEKIEREGLIRIGFQEDVSPFASFDKFTGKHSGFSVDMASQLVLYLSKRFDKHIQLVPITLKANTRTEMIEKGTIDIEMGASTQTYKRESIVDFSLVYFASETTFLVNKDSGIKTIQDLGNKRIAAATGTTNLQRLEQISATGQVSFAEVLAYDTHNLALWALVEGKADAYCADRVLMNTKRLQTPNPEKWHILENSIGYEPYAFMIPENNSDFRDFVNDTIRWTILTGKYFDVYEKWMGPLGIGPFKMSPSFKEYLGVITYPIPENWWKR